MTKKLTTSLFAIAAIAAAGFGFNSLTNQTPTTTTETAAEFNIPLEWLNPEEELAMGYSRCWDRTGEIPCPANIEPLNTFNAEELIAFSKMFQQPEGDCWLGEQKRWVKCSELFFGKNETESEIKSEFDVAMGWVLYVENDAQDDSNAETQTVFENLKWKQAYCWKYAPNGDYVQYDCTDRFSKNEANDDATDKDTTVAMVGNPQWIWVTSDWCHSRENPSQCNSRLKEEYGDKYRISEEQVAFEMGCYIEPYQKVPCPFNKEELNAFDAEEQIAFDHKFCETGKRGYKWTTTIGGHTFCGLNQSEDQNSFDAEQIAFDLTPCHQKRKGYRWGYGIFGTTCAWEGNSEELNAFEAEEQIAFDPISRGETCWIRDYEPVPCPSDSWNAEDVNAFEAEEQIAFDHTPCHQKRPGWDWGHGIFGTICVRRAGEELNAFEAEEQIASRGAEGRNGGVSGRSRCYNLPLSDRPYCFRAGQAEEMNAFEAQQIAFKTPNCVAHLGRSYCGDFTAESNAAALDNVTIALEKPQCIWSGLTVDCDSLKSGTQVTIAGANPYTQDANPSDTVDAVSQHLLAGADDDYELQRAK